MALRRSISALIAALCIGGYGGPSFSDEVSRTLNAAPFPPLVTAIPQAEKSTRPTASSRNRVTVGAASGASGFPAQIDGAPTGLRTMTSFGVLGALGVMGIILLTDPSGSGNVSSTSSTN